MVQALNIHGAMRRQGNNSKDRTAVIWVLTVPKALRLLFTQDTGVDRQAYLHLSMTHISEKMPGLRFC